MSHRESSHQGRCFFQRETESQQFTRQLSVRFVRESGVPMLMRLLGGVLLLSSLGLASCQAVVHAF
jgi:hypothetical protein